VGLLLGLCEGLTDGLTLGLTDGLAEGEREGLTEGLAEGESEGLCVGASVRFLGTQIGLPNTPGFVHVIFASKTPSWNVHMSGIKFKHISEGKKGMVQQHKSSTSLFGTQSAGPCSGFKHHISGENVKLKLDGQKIS